MRRGQASLYLARQAISEVRKNMDLPQKVTTAETVSVDATLLFITEIDKIRHEKRLNNHPYTLDELIQSVFSNIRVIPIERQIIYSNVVTRYYELVKAKNSKKRRG